MSTPLQRAQQAWAWRKAMIIGTNLKNVAHSIPLPSNKIAELYDLLEFMSNANDAKFKHQGGTIPKKEK